MYFFFFYNRLLQILMVQVTPRGRWEVLGDTLVNVEFINKMYLTHGEVKSILCIILVSCLRFFKLSSTYSCHMLRRLVTPCTLREMFVLQCHYRIRVCADIFHWPVLLEDLCRWMEIKRWDYQSVVTWHYQLYRFICIQIMFFASEK